MSHPPPAPRVIHRDAASSLHHSARIAVASRIAILDTPDLGVVRLRAVVSGSAAVTTPLSDTAASLWAFDPTRLDWNLVHRWHDLKLLDAVRVPGYEVDGVVAEAARKPNFPTAGTPERVAACYRLHQTLEAALQEGNAAFQALFDADFEAVWAFAQAFFAPAEAGGSPRLRAAS